MPVLVTPLVRRQFVDGRLQNTLKPWAQAISKVAAEGQVPLVDLNKTSAEAVSLLGPIETMRFAQRPPSTAAIEAAKTGTTMATEPAQARSDTTPTVRDPHGPQGRASAVYDHTHLGPQGPDYFSAMVAQLLARAAPELRKVLLP